MTGPLESHPADRLIVALDFEERDPALRLCDQLEGRLRWVKVGLELFTAEGPAVVADLIGRGLRVFLDLKLHDIPNTVERAAARCAAMGVSLITVHAGGGEEMIAAAVRGARTVAHPAAPDTGGPGVLAVTVLTSLSGDELPGYFNPIPVAERVLLLARAAGGAGAQGIVASPRELTVLRRELGAGFILLTPGIRFAGGEAGDQKRVATPYTALREGADYLVIGRPITRAPDPGAAFDLAMAEMARAMGL